MKKIGIIVIFLLVILLSSSFGRNIVYSQVATSSSSTTSSVSECVQKSLTGQACVDYLSGKVSDLKTQENSLASQIKVMSSQINLTQARIEATQEQITSLILDIDTTTKKISGLQDALNNLVGVLANRIVATYEVGTIQPFQILLTSSNASDFFKRLNYLKIAQEHDKKLVYDTQQAKVDYANQKVIFEDKKKKIEVLKKQLEDYTDQLSQEKTAKNQLLADTQGSEASYQSLLAQAKKELAGFASFADTQGGGALSGQTSCDGWGCYYNQRDNQWANALINNQNSGCGSDNGPCTVLRVGCLVTSVAMMASYLGHRDISPSDIAFSGSGNFSVGTADLKRNTTIYVKGIGINRNTIAGSLDPSLVQNGPVIVGFYYGPFGTHFVVIKSYSNGNYIMNDPYTEGGKDKIFTDYYSLGKIFEVDRVSM